MKILFCLSDDIMPKFVTLHNWPPIFERYVVSCDSNNGYRKDMFFSKENQILAPNMITIPGSISMYLGVGDLYDRLMRMRIFTLVLNEISCELQKL